MNKGFEVIEARWPSDGPEQIDVVIHPQSTIPSMVEYVDRSVLAQLGPTDNAHAHQYALTYPSVSHLNNYPRLEQLKRLDFQKVSTRRFPVPSSRAEKRDEKGRRVPVCAERADEIAVAGLLRRPLPFLEFPGSDRARAGPDARVRFEKMDDVLTADAEARRTARERSTNGCSGERRASDNVNVREEVKRVYEYN